MMNQMNQDDFFHDGEMLQVAGEQIGTVERTVDISLNWDI